MASLSFLGSCQRVSSLACVDNSAVTAFRGSVVQVECAHHVNKKATKRAIDRRPKKLSKWDKKRGGTKEYGPWPEAPPIWSFDPSEERPAETRSS